MDTKKLINVIDDLSVDVEKCKIVIDSTCTSVINDVGIESNTPVLLCVALDYIDIINKKIDALLDLL